MAKRKQIPKSYENSKKSKKTFEEGFSKITKSRTKNEYEDFDKPAKTKKKKKPAIDDLELSEQDYEKQDNTF